MRHVLPVGSAVRVRYAGIGDAFEGVVSQINGDGTYMIRYGDNDEERVPREWLSQAEADEDEVSVISDADSSRGTDLTETLLLARRAADESTQGGSSSMSEVPLIAGRLLIDAKITGPLLFQSKYLQRRLGQPLATYHRSRTKCAVISICLQDLD